MKILEDLTSALSEHIISQHYYILIEKGTGCICINENKYDIESNYVIVLNPLDLFNFEYQSDLSGICLKFSEDELLAVKKSFINKPSGVYRNVNYDYLSSIIYSKEKLLSNFDIDNKLLEEIAVTSIQNELCKDKVITVYPFTSSKKLRFILDYYFNHLDEIDSTSSLSDAVGIKQYRLNSLFENLFEIKIKKIILELKCITVNELVMQGTAIKAAVSNVGFRSYATFLSYYKQIYGCKPSDFITDKVSLNYQDNQISKKITKYL